MLNSQRRGGDGTVPYPSLSYCKNWKDSVNVRIAEIEGMYRSFIPRLFCSSYTWGV